MPLVIDVSLRTAWVSFSYAENNFLLFRLIRVQQRADWDNQTWITWKEHKKNWPQKEIGAKPSDDNLCSVSSSLLCGRSILFVPLSTSTIQKTLNSSRHIADFKKIQANHQERACHSFENIRCVAICIYISGMRWILTLLPCLSAWNCQMLCLTIGFQFMVAKAPLGLQLASDQAVHISNASYRLIEFLVSNIEAYCRIIGCTLTLVGPWHTTCLKMMFLAVQMICPP